MRNDTRGYSLAELVVAVGILAVGILTVVGLFTSLLRTSYKNEDLSGGVAVADAVLNERIYGILNGLGPVSRATFFANDSPPDPPIEGAMVLNNTTYTYRIYRQTLTDPGGTPVGQALPENTVKKVDIVVWWWNSDPGQARAGYGYLTTGASRIINEKATY